MSFYYVSEDSFSMPYMTEERISKTGLNFSVFEFNGTLKDGQNLSVFRHHHHELFELILIKDGEFKITLEDKEWHLKKGDVMIMNPFEVHYGEWIANSVHNEYICFIFSPKTHFSTMKDLSIYDEFKRFSSGDSVFENFIPADSPAAMKIEKLLEDMENNSNLPSLFAECKALSLFYEFLSVLFEECYIIPGELKETTRNLDFIRQTTLYINENYSDQISTTDIAKALFMTSSRFCHAFRQNFGMNFSNYLCKFRTIRASEIYKNSKMPLTEIAAAVGFMDYNYFSKVFKKYIGESPARYFGRWNK